MNIILVLLISISLSMDAFSLALAYGTISLRKKEILILSAVVGIYHFFMPILGMLVGKRITDVIHLSGNIFVLIIFSIIGIEMLISSFKKSAYIKKMKIIEMLFFGFAVSLDSFSVGIGITDISKNYISCSFVFATVSFIFTFIGLLIGDRLNKFIGKLATMLGGISLILIGLTYFFNKF